MKVEIEILFDRQFNMIDESKNPTINGFEVSTTNDNTYGPMFKRVETEYINDCLVKYILTEPDMEIPGMDYFVSSIDMINHIKDICIFCPGENNPTLNPIPVKIVKFDIYDYACKGIESNEFMDIETCGFDNDHVFAKYSFKKSMLEEFSFSDHSEIAGFSISCNFDQFVEAKDLVSTEYSDMIDEAKEKAKKCMIEKLQSTNGVEDFDVDLITTNKKVDTMWDPAGEEQTVATANDERIIV